MKLSAKEPTQTQKKKRTFVHKAGFSAFVPASQFHVLPARKGGQAHSLPYDLSFTEYTIQEQLSRGFRANARQAHHFDRKRSKLRFACSAAQSGPLDPAHFNRAGCTDQGKAISRGLQGLIVCFRHIYHRLYHRLTHRATPYG